MIYLIKDTDGNVINRINATAEFVAANFEFYELEIIEEPEMVKEDKATLERAWRDRELARTDAIVPVTDRPEHASYISYREALRDYPEQEDFPNGIRPELVV